MDSRNKRILKQQLEQQAAQLVAQTDDAELVAGIITSCTALLRAAESSMPGSFTPQSFEQIFSGYLGLASRVRSFCQSNRDYMEQTAARNMEQLELDLTAARQEREELNARIAALETQIADMQEAVELSKLHRDKKQAGFDAVSQEHQGILTQANALEDQTRKLKADLDTLRRRIDSFESDIQSLTEETAAANENYRELTAYYEELERIEAGIQAEGFADVQSFTQHIREMNQQGTGLMADYDRILKSLFQDISDLQKKIDKRRQPGAL